MKVKVSVIMPSLNVADYIMQCLDSVVNQSLCELEIICIDAGSTDGTADILVDYEKRDARIVLLHSDIKSYGRQVNLGLDYASGEYVAILETDDWIEADMYKELYEYAMATGTDYVAADFDKFWRLQSESSYLIRQHLFGPEQQNWYGRVLDSDEIATLRASDYVLWKGIYKREFLNANHIRLHESPGAAFQDMGFLQQIKTFAKRAAYLDRSFYRYRQDRGEASSRGLEGLQYYEKEFRWINEELKLNSILKGIHRKYYYFTMSISFITKYEQIVKRLEGDWQDKRLRCPYIWFQKQIVRAIDSGFLEETMYKKELWSRLKLLLDSQEKHSQLIMECVREKKKGEQELLNRIENRPVIIFGCGKRGERLMLFCENHQVGILGFCDNNIALHGSKKYGFPIISPVNLKEEIEKQEGTVLLSIKNGDEQVSKQLIEMGISLNRIINNIRI